MDNSEDRIERRPGFNVGSASIIMVFAVLCLTIFSVLSLTTAASDLRLSRRSAKSIADYYEAEFLAETKALEINDLLKSGLSPYAFAADMEVDVKQQEDFVSIIFNQPVDGRRYLRVELEYQDDRTLVVAGWRLLPDDDWEPSAGMNVWQGN